MSLKTFGANDSTEQLWMFSIVIKQAAMTILRFAYLDRSRVAIFNSMFYLYGVWILYDNLHMPWFHFPSPLPAVLSIPYVNMFFLLDTGIHIHVYQTSLMELLLTHVTRHAGMPTSNAGIFGRWSHM